MAVDIKKILTSLKERKETTLVWGLGAIALSLGVFLLMGYIRGAPPPPSLEVIVKRRKTPKSKEEIIAQLRGAQKIPPFVHYRDILTRSLFLESRAGAGIKERVLRTGGFVLKGLIQMPDEIKAFINDPAGKPHLVGKGQRISTTGVRVDAIDFKNQSATLMHKDWTKPQVIKMAREEIGKAKDIITFKPSEEKKEVEKPKRVTGEEAKKAIIAAKLAIRKADSNIVDASGTEADTSEAIEKRDGAKEKLKEAQEAYLTKDYAKAQDLALEAKKLAKEALRLVEEAEIEEEEIEEEEEE